MRFKNSQFAKKLTSHTVYNKSWKEIKFNGKPSTNYKTLL